MNPGDTVTFTKRHHEALCTYVNQGDDGHQRPRPRGEVIDRYGDCVLVSWRCDECYGGRLRGLYSDGAVRKHLADNVLEVRDD